MFDYVTYGSLIISWYLNFNEQVEVQNAVRLYFDFRWVRQSQKIKWLQVSQNELSLIRQSKTKIQKFLKILYFKWPNEKIF